MFNKHLFSLLAFYLVFAPHSVSASVILDIDQGKLKGARNVVIDSTLYDVRFEDGSCEGVFNGCDGPSDFTFTTEASATAAANALLDQVFLDSSSGQFDTEPFSTFGCSHPDWCFSYIPYVLVNSDRVGVVLAFNGREPDYSDSPSATFLSIADDLSQTDYLTYTTLTLSLPVPAPNGMFLIGASILGLFGRNGRGKNSD